jgi:hypothetical protein
MIKWLLGLTFVVLCLTLLVPYTDYRWTYSVPVFKATPAGPLGEGRLIEQTLVIPGGEVGECVGIYFATYARSNSNHLVVTLQSGGDKESWTLSSRSLRDNAYHYFCPAWSRGIRSSLLFSVRGVGGTSANSPTLWLTSDKSGGVADLGGTTINKGVSFALADRSRVSVALLARIAHGAFVVGWAVTLLMGLAGIVAAWVSKPQEG